MRLWAAEKYRSRRDVGFLVLELERMAVAMADVHANPHARLGGGGVELGDARGDVVVVVRAEVEECFVAGSHECEDGPLAMNFHGARVLVLFVEGHDQRCPRRWPTRRAGASLGGGREQFACEEAAKQDAAGGGLKYVKYLPYALAGCQYDCLDVANDGDSLPVGVVDEESSTLLLRQAVTITRVPSGCCPSQHPPSRGHR